MQKAKDVLSLVTTVWFCSLPCVVLVFAIVGVLHALTGVPLPTNFFESVLRVLLSPLIPVGAVAGKLPEALGWFLLGCLVGGFFGHGIATQQRDKRIKQTNA